MKSLAILFVMQLGGAVTLYSDGADAQQAMTDQPSAAVRSCITASAPDVERTIESLTDATDFLVQKVCAGQIADQIAEISRKQAEEQKARMDEMCKAQDATPPDTSTRTGRAGLDYTAQMCHYRGMYDDASISMITAYGFAGTNAPQATSLAAQTLLKLRADRTAKKR